MGGGTFQPVSNHLSLSAPAFGTVAEEISRILFHRHHITYKYPYNENEVTHDVVLTKMADRKSKLMTNDDVKNYVMEAIKDPKLGIIFMSVAFCDFHVEGGDFHGQRLETSEGEITLNIKPTEKVLDLIRRERPDIFLVGFKTTTNCTAEEQFLKGLKMMKRSKCNLVLANDTVTRNNIIITPEETWYPTKSREDAIEQLVGMAITRGNATFHRTNFNLTFSNISMSNTPDSFQKVVKGLIDAGAFIENNGNGFTPGHFCWRSEDRSFLSSQRKANHNRVFEEGLSLVDVGDDNEYFTVTGTRKASVGARSQWMILQENPGYDCIVHTHSPMKDASLVPSTPQKPYQCGSLECGLNTLNHMKDFGIVKAVYLEKHGPNILFKSSSDPDEVLNFIKENFQLNIKTT